MTQSPDSVDANARPAARDLPGWLEYIEQLHPRGIDMGLARVREVADRLGVRTPAPLRFVVGGTNGKGSTTTAIEQCLLAQGRSVGATFSPHLFRFNERIRVDGREVDDDTLCAAFAAIDAARAELSLTYFEFGMLAALWCFARAGVDAAVIEVGLGGRLDAANIVDADVAVITTIGLDHMDYLGPDRESIGFDKAHIARTGRPLVLGEPDPPARLLEVVQRIGATLVRRGDLEGGFTCAAVADARGLRISYRGPRERSEVQVATALLPENIGTALAALEAAGCLPDAATLARGLAAASVPGRLQCVAGADGAAAPVYVDVAHNPHGAAYVAAELQTPARSVRGRTHIVLATLGDKDAAGIVRALRPVASRWWLAGTRGARACTAEALRTVVDAVLAAATPHAGDPQGDNAVQVYEDVASALRAARAAAGAGDRVVVCGCFQAAADALAALEALPARALRPAVADDGVREGTG